VVKRPKEPTKKKTKWKRGVKNGFVKAFFDFRSIQN
jgi:hypothetical protein